MEVCGPVVLTSTSREKEVQKGAVMQAIDTVEATDIGKRRELNGYLSLALDLLE